MTRRLLGPIGGPIVFFLVAALVFSGLGWLTYTALQVEQAQREAAARAELGHNLRVALWRLDGGMLLPVSGEDNRPFDHFAPSDPANTPLLAQTLPDWMKLHFNLDPAEGWCSPQVPPPESTERIRTAWADVSPRNLKGYRCAVLDDIKERYPARDTIEAFVATCRTMPDDALALTSPHAGGTPLGTITPDAVWNTIVQAPSAPTLPPPAIGQASNSINPGVNLDNNSDSFCLFGWELCLRNNSQLATNDPLHQKVGDGNQAGGNQRGNSQAPGVSSRGGRMGMNPKDIDNYTQSNDPEAQKRSQILDRSQREAKQAAEHLLPKGQLQNYNQWFDPRMTGNSAYPNVNPGNNTIIPPGLGNTGNLGGQGGLSQTPQGGPPAAPGINPEKFNRDEKSKNDKDVPPGAGDMKESAVKAEDAMKTRAAEQEKLDLLLNSEREFYKNLDKETAASTLESFGWLERADNNRLRRQVLDENKLRPTTTQGDELKKLSDTDKIPPVTTLTVPPSPEAATPLIAAPLPFAIHLGSMRPQWVTAPDGSEMLVLVRPARVDNKTIFQGVVIDWAKLEVSLREEVKDLFPEARLTPLKDPAGGPPERTMSALPVQLDPGPEQPLPPAGWTTLRVGLVLAWLAAIIALAAVGFAGWSLIDLAERRIRFVSAVTHELRTPLTSLRLYLDLLVSGMIQDETKRQEYLNTLAGESDRLHRLIDNVLDFAKLEKRKRNGDIKPVKITDFMDQLRQTWTDRVAVDGKELVVISTLPPEQEVSTDSAMLQQIVGNLIDNARKYSREAIDKRIWVWAKPGIGNAVLLEVEDRGAGVPASERKSIFKPFRRGDTADSKAGGAGLGLALAKSWAEVLGARLTYRPADGGTGACFRLELPGK